MARQKYLITPQDFYAAYDYLRRKLQLDLFWLDDSQALEQFQSLKRDAVTLNDWCERWLDRRRWAQLKAAIRAARQRQRRRHNAGQGPDIQLRLPRTAGLVLRDLAKRDGITVSEFILRHHYQEWLYYDADEAELA